MKPSSITCLNFLETNSGWSPPDFFSSLICLFTFHLEVYGSFLLKKNKSFKNCQFGQMIKKRYKKNIRVLKNLIISQKQIQNSGSLYTDKNIYYLNISQISRSGRTELLGGYSTTTWTRRGGGGGQPKVPWMSTCTKT